MDMFDAVMRYVSLLRSRDVPAEELAGTMHEAAHILLPSFFHALLLASTLVSKALRQLTIASAEL
jgi:hypothetical protein